MPYDFRKKVYCLRIDCCPSTRIT